MGLLIKPRKRTPSRCNKCAHRQTFPMDPTLYEKPKFCICGGQYKADTYRIKTEHRRVMCKCSGYAWSIHNAGHRKGSPKCYFNADGTERPVEDGAPITIE